MGIKNKTLRLILGDQLNINHSWFETVDDDDLNLCKNLQSIRCIYLVFVKFKI